MSALRATLGSPSTRRHRAGVAARRSARRSIGPAARPWLAARATPGRSLWARRLGHVADELVAATPHRTQTPIVPQSRATQPLAAEQHAGRYLPAKVVTAAMDELGWRAKWIGSYTREDTTAPIPELRQTAQQLKLQLKLLRKYRGQLLVTKTGAALRDDPRGAAPPSGPVPAAHPTVVDLDERRTI